MSRQVQRTVHTVCATCPRELSTGDRTQGCRRCKVCRTETPGVVVLPDLPISRAHTPTLATKKAFGQWTIKNTQKDPVPKESESWWMKPQLLEDRAAFQQHARTRHPGGERGRAITPRAGAKGAFTSHASRGI